MITSFVTVGTLISLSLLFSFFKHFSCIFSITIYPLSTLFHLHPPPRPPPPHTHHATVHVHESFFFSARSLHPLTSACRAVSLLSIYAFELLFS